jgi:hypothetical protein
MYSTVCDPLQYRYFPISNGADAHQDVGYRYLSIFKGLSLTIKGAINCSISSQLCIEQSHKHSLRFAGWVVQPHIHIYDCVQGVQRAFQHGS